MDNTVFVAGLKVSNLTKRELLEEFSKRLRDRKKTVVITPYSEFLYAVLHKPDLLPDLNRADFSVADGVGVLWASLFLSIPFRTKYFYLKIFEGLVQMLVTLSAILLSPRSIRKIIPEKIVGADLIWDIARIASEENRSVFLLGGYNETPELVRAALLEKYPNLIIAGTSNKGPEDPHVIEDIVQARPDILFVAYGPVRQDVWIAKHVNEIPVSFAIGLGGTFDYLAGIKKTPPRFVRSIGLEWLYRLFTQPSRLRRIRNATFGMLLSMLRYKVFISQPLRRNAVVVILDQNNNALVCKRKFILGKDPHMDSRFKNYWQFPQGGIDDGEGIAEGAAREAFEETGLENLELIKISNETNSYDWRNGARPLFFNRLKFRGQAQHIVYFKFLGDPHSVRLDNRELEEYDWIPLLELQNRLHAERQPLVGIVLSDITGRQK